MNDDVQTTEGPGAASAEPSIASLVGGIVADAQELIKQQFVLLGRELQEEFRQAKTAAISLGIGVAIAAVGALLLILMLVHVLNAFTTLPLWGCYGIAGGVLAAIGAGFFFFGAREAADVKVLPPVQTTEALKENLEWLTNQKLSNPA